MRATRASSGLAIDAFLQRLPELALIVGKGGVGKTTCAIGIAARLAARGNATLLVSTDPALSLGPALGVALSGGELREIAPVLFAMQLDPVIARQAFLARWRDVLVTIVDRGTYLDAEDIAGLVDASFPGADEIFGLLVLAQLVSERRAPRGERWTHLVIDTAPTGHTLRLLELPETFDAMVALLEAMQAKHRFMVNALTHRYQRDAADKFLDEMRGTLGTFRFSLGDVKRAGAVVVTRAEQVVVSETERYVAALGRLGIAVAAIVVEAMPAARSAEIGDALLQLERIAPEKRLFAVGRVDPPPVGIAAAERSLGEMMVLNGSRGRGAEKSGSGSKRLERQGKSGLTWKAGGPPDSVPRGEQERQLGDLVRTLTIVGGKGGVGKTTVSCALALATAFDSAIAGDVLLVSTDPAPSIADALGIGIPRWAHDGPEPLPAIPKLRVWQMDATAAFLELRHRYRDRIDAVFDSFMGKSIEVAHDRAILRDLLSLAPPGIDELYALASLGDALAQKQYARIVVDPAPTGHLLRLLQLPALAVEWSHRLMRLILKYKEIAGLGVAAEDLLNFSRRTRGLEKLLHDGTHAGVVLVSLDEPAVAAETSRLANMLHSVEIAILGEVRNRTRLATEATARPTFVAPEFTRPLVGVPAILDWAASWKRQN